MNLKKHVNYLFFFIIFVILIICILIFFKFFKTSKKNNSQVENKNLFAIEKIIIYSNVLCIDNSEFQKPVFNINLHQLSDISIYLNKVSDYQSDENTIKNLYIDNFKFENFKSGVQSVYLKDKNNFGIFSESDIKNSESILNYKVISKNSEKNNTNTFYYDFSEPIIFEFANKNVLENYIIKETTNKITFDGSILSNLKIPKEYFLNGSISFDIHIINNLGKHYINTISLSSFLEENNNTILNGAIYKIFLNENINQGGFYEFRNN